MLQPAMMCKITEPSGTLYEIRAISDSEIAFANSNFLKNDQPYRVIRHQGVVADHVAA